MGAHTHTAPARDGLYREAAETFGPALTRLARSYEAQPDKQRDLLQEIHLALWQSLASFRGSCTLRTWVYRVAHNVAATHVGRQKRDRSRQLVSLEAVDEVLVDRSSAGQMERASDVDRLYALVHTLKPMERQIILLYLEGCDAAVIADITGISTANVATKIHRIKRILAARHTGSAS